MRVPLHGDLDGCYVISLRPAGAHAGLRAAAARHGARLVALSTLRIAPRTDADARRRLRAALTAGIVVFTSPAAVRAASALQRLRRRRGQGWLALGSGTASALRRAGIAGAQAPGRMDSEGLLAMPALQSPRGLDIGLVTAPGGRDRLAPALRERGARVLRADVYARDPVAWNAAARRRLAEVLRYPPARVFLALSSGEALQAALAQVQEAERRRLCATQVVAASARLAALARAAGWRHVAVAASARPADLAAAMRAARTARAD